MPWSETCAMDERMRFVLAASEDPAAEWLEVPADRAGRMKVEPDLTIPGHPEIFAIGDAAIVASRSR
jgi:NADH dehydrogenase FAD-containing subunit